MHFLTIAREVCGTPAAERDDLSENERMCLEHMQTAEGISMPLLDLRTFIKGVETLARLSEQDTLSDTDVVDVRLYLSAAMMWETALEKSDMYPTWDLYMKCILSDSSTSVRT